MNNSVIDFIERKRDLNPEDLLAKNTSYHKSCYADIANTTKIELMDFQPDENHFQQRKQ